MSKKVNPAAVGAFALGALALGVVTLLVVGSGRYFEARRRVVFYFDCPLEGLDIGAPVEFRGVRLGTVTDVAIEYDTQSSVVHMPVRAELDPARVRARGDKPDDPQMTGLQEKIRNGMRATLALQSLVTGKTKIDLDMHTNLPPAEIGFENGALVIPTVAGPWERIATELETVPFAEIAMNTQRSIQRIADLLESAELAGTVTNLNRLTGSAAAFVEQLQKLPLEETLAALKKSVEAMEKNLGEAKVGETAESLRATLARMQKSLEALEAGVEDGRLLLRETRDQVSPAREETVALLRELSATSRALRELVGRIDEQPESLIQGKR